MSTQIDNWLNLSSVKVCEYLLNTSIRLTNTPIFFVNGTKTLSCFFIAGKIKLGRGHAGCQQWRYWIPVRERATCCFCLLSFNGFNGINNSLHRVFQNILSCLSLRFWFSLKYINIDYMPTIYKGLFYWVTKTTVLYVFCYMAKKKRGSKVSPDMAKLANRIKALREQSGRSKEAFAADADLSRTLYPKYENGANITYASLLKIITALDITVTEFFSDGFD
jgi:DNA-binding XRE family transcriptional regulator